MHFFLHCFQNCALKKHTLHDIYFFVLLPNTGSNLGNTTRAGAAKPRFISSDSEKTKLMGAMGYLLEGAVCHRAQPRYI
jgi:hypothetical protein